MDQALVADGRTVPKERKFECIETCNAFRQDRQMCSAQCDKNWAVLRTQAISTREAGVVEKVVSGLLV